MILKRTARLSAGIALGVAAAVTPLALSSSASAATPSPTAPQKVASGINVAALPGAAVFGTTPASTPEDVSFILRERNVGALKVAAQVGIRHYLSVGQFASVYGQTTSNINALTAYLAKFGIKTTVYADKVDVSATGTAGEFDSALSVTQKQYHVPAQAGRDGLSGVPAQTVHGNVGSALLPYRLSNFVLAILGLSNYAPYADHAVKATTDLLKPQAGSSNSCLATFGLPNGCHLPSYFSKTYNLNPLYAHGATGSGQTVGIVTLAAVDPGAPEHFWDNIAHVKRTGSLTVDNIDGGPGAPSLTSGSDETDLDIEQSGALAPGANVISYQAPNTDPGFADAFFTAASQNTASDVSASWGESETIIEAAILSGEEPATYAAAFDEAFLEMAVQGQSAFTSSADAGAYTASEDLGTTNLSADNPADSPYITAAGGTTLPWTGTLTGPDGTATVSVKAQRIWGWDYLWPAVAATTGVSLATAAETHVVGSGGGFSQFYPTPLYQEGISGTHNFHAVEYLTPTDYTTVAPGLSEPTAWDFNPTPPVTSGGGNGRAVPDVSTNADPETGYLVYGASVGGLNEYGGTSFVAPQLNGSTAVIDSYLGHRVGFWNPSIYAAATSGQDPFTQLNQASTSNDNIYYTGNPGEKYNEGIGLGLPDLAKLAGEFTR
ncbi:MAG: S53 family peptidase [Streptosporangiaceae bacterium]